MILDNELQRKMLIDIIEAGTFSGQAIRPISQLLYQIETATIATTDEPRGPAEHPLRGPDVLFSQKAES